MAANNPLVAVKLYGGGKTINMWIEGGIRRLRELFASPSSLFWAGGGPGRYGDGEPDFAFNEQRTAEGGRGLEYFADDPTRYYDSLNVWTLTPSRIGPSPQWFFGTGVRPNGAEYSLPGNVSWQPMYESRRYTELSVTPSANITADKAYFWIRKVGEPGTLTLELASDSSGDPNTVLKTATVTTATITDVLSVLHEFDWTGTEALTGSTVYHLKLYGASTDDASDHWEVAVDFSGSSSQYSSDDTAWSAAGFSMYYRLVGADIATTHKFFELDEVTYAVSLYDTATSSRLWMNGARGEATAGASTTLTNSNAAFGTASEFDGALVKIIRGTGAGQVRTISSHTGTVLTVSEAWDINPSTDSEYKVYQTPRWTEITTTGLGQVQSVAVYNNIAHFGHKASGDPIRKIRFNAGATPPAHEFADDSTNEANILAVGHIAGTGVVLWRAVNGAGSSNISRGPAVGWGTAHTFATAFAAGNGQYPVTAMVEYTDENVSRMYVLKTGEIGFVDADKWYRLNVQVNALTLPTNGRGAIVHGIYLYWPWANSLERLYGSALDDLDPNREGGFPTNRQGIISALAAHPVGVLVALDAGDDGYSSVLFFDGRGYHEVFRAWETGKRIKDMYLQPNESGKTWLWVSVGDDLIYMQFPVRNPFRDTSQTFMHEFAYETATFDMGNGAIFKAWKDLTINSRNLDGQGKIIKVDYQEDGDIDSASWVTAGVISESPSDSLDLFIGENKQIRYRIRGQTDIATTPPLVNGIVSKGVGQLPNKRDWTFWVRFGSIAKAVGGDATSSIERIKEGTNRARIWEIVECNDYKAIVGVRVLANIVEIDPEFSVNNEDNVRAQIHLSEISG